MSRQKDAYEVGEIAGLSLSEKLVLEALVKQPLDNWSLVNKTVLSESSIIKALRKLKTRGLVVKEHSLNRIPNKLLKKVKGD